MSYIYEPEVVEEDSGYSIPKILVAVLLLALMGAGVYIYLQKSKIKDSVARLKSDKKEVKQELDSLIAIYNLAIEDNDYLKDVYDEEKARIEAMKIEIDNLPDDANITSFKPQIRDIVENQKIIAPTIEEESLKTVVNNPIVTETIKDNVTESAKDDTKSNKEKKNTVTTSSVKKEGKATTTNNETEAEVNAVVKNDAVPTTKTVKSEDTTAKQDATKENKKEEEKLVKPVITSTSLNKADIPPTYPGCSGNAAQKKKCFSAKVRAFVSKEFDVSIASNLGLSPGRKRINVSMTIDKYGKVTGIRARAPHKKLEEEAIRVVKRLPKMMPARHEGNVVSIKNFIIPITINIEE